MRKLLGVILVLPFLIWAGVRVVNDIQFDRNCEGYLKRAADANTVELADKNLAIAVKYLEDNSHTSGYTSVLWQTPDEDVGFWYTNLKASQNELRQLKPDATPMERSNMLMKLRETLVDEGKSTSVTVPGGMDVFPNNLAYALWCIVGVMVGIIGVFVFIWGLDAD